MMKESELMLVAVHDLSASERYGNDIRDGDTCPEVGVGGRPVVTRQSAVLPSVGGDGESLGSGVVDALLGVLSASQSSPVNPPDQRQPQVIPIKRGCSPLIEWYDNAKMLAEQWIEAVCSTGVFAEARPWCDAWREAHDGKTSRAFNVVVPDASVDYSGFLLASEKMACSTNVHTHSQTCRKGVRGRYACRLSRPAGVHGKATQHLLVRLKASSHLGKRKRAEFVVESASCVAAAIDLRQSDEKRLFREYTNGAVVWEQRRPASDALFVETNLALVCLSRSHTNAALISGLDSGLVAYAAGCVVCPTSSGDEYCDIASCDIEDDAAKRSTSGVSAADEICFQREHSAHNYDESLEADDVQRHLEILVAADVEDGSDDQSVTGGARKAHARMFTADKKVFFVTQPESYRHRGVWLEAYSPTEFEMIVDILPRVPSEPASKTYRCAQNEKTCSEWRSRNVQFWADPVSSTISQAGGHHVKSPDVDMEAVGAILPEDIFDMTIAAAAKDIKAVNAARAMKSTFLSLSPMATEFGFKGEWEFVCEYVPDWDREGVSRNDLELLRLTFTDRVGVVVVDEVSMFSAEFLVLLDHRLRTVYKNNIVFGGRSIILLDVIAGVPLCKVLYMNTRSDVLLSARALFRQFKVFFLHTQHRAATCQLQLANLAACRALPRFIPSGQRWTESESAEFRPMTADVVKSLTPKLTMEDVLNGPAWLDETTVIVTSNVDKAILTAPAAALFADRHGQLLFRWKRRLRQELPVGLQNLVYD
ncbi:uncharacterized protein PITG_01520 [Phytophthora infestans T30-4]|uniref:Uncharacterized protein n=1 Tax=Phytophthora infestans (strain T30-4) TaxID=403677 RepID=D0MTG2_PHYIT|nr:uncharacterized protein PITG_01520 [Phytophthora infestans T30-4]EEY61259.1 hypothetical protein PITG_01520 [Phytophthora infestans T30-4]|eukprot:XP_002908176.1 hypothetical protein PITG_01520 [Phytophthora infestans T30-4]